MRADNQFDLVVSGDVLEHILPEQADDVVSELVRVSKRHIVISISLKSHGNERLHTLLRPRHWWEAKFQKHGARPNRALFWALQEKQVRFSRDKGELESCRQEGVEDDGGKFEVCLVKLVRQERLASIVTEGSSSKVWLLIGLQFLVLPASLPALTLLHCHPKCSAALADGDPRHGLPTGVCSVVGHSRSHYRRLVNCLPTMKLALPYPCRRFAPSPLPTLRWSRGFLCSPRMLVR